MTTQPSSSSAPGDIFVTTRWFHLVLVPLAWGGCSLIHFRFPGDEYAMWAVSSLAGSWILFCKPDIGDIHQAWIPLSVGAVGSLVMAGVGWLLVWLKVWKRLWIALFIGASAGWLALALSAYPSMERALAKNGSWWAYIFSSVLLGSYVAGILSLSLAPLIRWLARKGQSAK